MEKIFYCSQTEKVGGSIWNIEQIFLAERFQGEDVVDLHDAGADAAFGDLGGQVAAFEADEATGDGQTIIDGAWGLRTVTGGFFQEGAGPGVEVFERGYGAGYGHVECAAFYFFCAAVLCRDIGKPCRLAYGFHHFDLLTDAVHQVEGGVGEKDGQGYAGEASSCADVDDLHVFFKPEGSGDAQGVEDVFFVEAVDVLAGDDVDLVIPFFIQRFQGGELL